MKTIAYLFDIDGVLTNEKLVVNQQILKKISEFVTRGSKVGFITGRSSTWLLENVLNPLAKLLTQQDFAQNIYAAGEFGAILFENENGFIKPISNQDFIVPDEIKKSASEKFERFNETMWIEPKLAMFTVVAKPEIPLDTFHDQQKELVSEFEEILNQNNLKDKFEIQSDFIAINIRAKNNNKTNATDGFINWLNNANLVYVFGDSPSDYEMALELKKQNIEYKFISVRSANDFSEKKDENIESTNSQLDAGTLEYLNSL